MNWYYSVNNEQKGPLDQPAFDQLVRQGVITATTLVWREGMAEWQAYGTLRTGPVAAAGANMTDCAECDRTFPEGDLVLLGGRMVCAGCKPVILQRMREGAISPDLAAEHTRKEHLNHEASIKSVGALYLLGSVFMTFGGIALFFTPAQQTIGTAIVFLLLAPLQFFIGLGLRRLKPWTRIAGALMSGIGLLAFPLGTLINGYILYLLVSKKGQMVFSEEYKNIIATTPHIKYRTSIIVWIGLILILLLFALAMVGFVTHK